MSQNTQLSSRRLAILGVLWATANVGVCFSLLNTILAVIKQDLHASYGELQWMMNIYGVLIASCLVLMGRLADLYGRKRLLLCGMVGLIIGLLFSGFAPSPGFIILGQALFGLSAAIMLPVSQAVMIHLYPDGKQSQAMGLWTSVVGIALGLGPVVGGFIVTYLNWRWVFFVIAISTFLSLLFVATKLNKDRTPSSHEKLDLWGALLLMLTIGSFVLATLQLESWSREVLLALYVLSLICLITLIFVERFAKDPIVHPEFIRNKTFLLASIINGLILFLVWAAFFLVPLYLITQRQLTPLTTGLVMLFITVPLTILSPIVGKFYQIVGVKKLIVMGLLLLLVTTILQLTFGLSSALVLILVANILFGLGWGLAWGPSATAALSALPRSQSGLASGTFVTFQEIGGTLGLAIAGTVFRLQPIFMQGFHYAMWVLLVICVLALLLSWWLPKAAYSSQTLP